MNPAQRESTEVKFNVPWGHIAAKIYGSASESKILMVHGILDNAGTFDRLLELLPRKYQYVCIDLPGHGLSSPFAPGVALHFFDYVHSITYVLDALNWKTCIYIGHSFGAHIGTYFSILYPGRLEKVIALDGTSPIPIKDPVSHVQRMYNFNSYAKDTGTLYTKDEILYALKFRRQETLKTEAAEALFKRAVTKVNDLYKYNRDVRLRHFVRPIFTFDQHKEFLIKLSTPLLLIMADNSHQSMATFKLVEQFEKICDENQFTVVVVKGNHDVHNNYPERVAPHICKFLSNQLKSKL
nr:PREDICTED: serine hydrolase-like protein [Megachile rotundata]XP_012140345.1 PREDICTED: serine hydrolase-like protein [Megachile rotundata]